MRQAQGTRRLSSPAGFAESSDRSNLIREQKHLRHGKGLSMGDGQERSAGLHGLEGAQRCARQAKLRWTTAAKHFDVLPDDAARQACAEGFHRGFLGGKSTGEVRHRIPAPRTIFNLGVGKDPPQKALSIALEDVAHTRNVGRVKPSPMMLMSQPQPNGAFTWVQEPWGAALTCTALPAPHLFTSADVELRDDVGRSGGRSTVAWGDPRAAAARPAGP